MFKFLKNLFLKKTLNNPAQNVFKIIVEQSRKNFFYEELNVPDTFEGRFEILVLHTFLVVRCLKGDKLRKNLGRGVMTKLFDDFDLSLREMGIGDMGIGHKIKTMADSFYGRCKAYEDGLNSEDKNLQDAIIRNIFRGVSEQKISLFLTNYVKRQAKIIEMLSFQEIKEGKFNFQDIIP